MEISIIRNGKNVWNYESKSIKNNVRMLSFAPLLVAIPNLTTPDANVEWLDKQLPTPTNWTDDIRTVADFCRSIKEFIEKVIWCLANPFDALFKFMIWIEPMLLLICILTSTVGFILYAVKINKFLGKTTSEYIKNPVIFYLLFKIVLYALGLAI